MNTPTEAHYDLRRLVIYSDADEGAELIAESEARAVAAAVTALTCTHHNDKQRAECPVCLVTHLTAERDQFRAEVKSCGELSCDECNARTAALMVERDHWQKIAVSASQEREHNANVAQAMTAERDQLRAELANQTVRFHDEIVRRQGTVRANQELDLRELNHFRDLLDAERARLDWFHEAASDRIWLVGQDIRAAIDAAMQEDAK